MLLVPGLIGIAELHPYEYVYYNALMGGTSGAAEKYELDYWCVSGREAMGYVNSVAGQGARVAVVGNLRSFNPVQRSDLLVFHDPSAKSEPDFALICNKHVYEDIFPDMATTYAVTRGDAVMAIVKTAVRREQPLKPR